jgi:hypothetical protein
VSGLRLVVNNVPPPVPFPFNPEAVKASNQVCAAYHQADPSDYISGSSVGATGTAEKFRTVMKLFEQAAALLQQIDDDPEEKQRYEHWEDIYDNPEDRPELFDKSPY